jgi:D-alanyl-D-alanine carboxypeptidase
MPTVPAPARLLATAGLASALLLAGCGDDDTGSDTTTDAAGTAPALDAPLTDELQDVADSTVDDLGAPGAVVVVTTPDESWETAVGVTDLDSGDPMTEGLAWPIRSITKSFTTTLVLQLADEGELSLDDTIDTWVPDVPDGDRITVRQLADMTSGLADYTTDAWADDFVADPTRDFSVDELIAYGTAEPPLAEPGTERVYTNLNTLLLGEVVEAVTGEPFVDVLDERILGPLDLDATVYPTDPDQWATDVTGYAPDDGGPLVDQPVNYSVFGPAGAMIATTDDLTAWGRALADGDLLDSATQDERLEGGALEEGPEYDRYAFGIGEIDGWWGHTGEGFGFTALVMHEVDTETTVVVAMNVSQLETHGPTTLFRRLAPLLTN